MQYARIYSGRSVERDRSIAISNHFVDAVNNSTDTGNLPNGCTTSRLKWRSETA